MKPNTIDSIIIEIANDNFHDDKDLIAKHKDTILDLFMSCVPEESSSALRMHNAMSMIGWDNCRDQMIKNLERLK